MLHCKHCTANNATFTSITNELQNKYGIQVLEGPLEAGFERDIHFKMLNLKD